jgi:branched-chain amino acid transport system permease protein
MTLLTRQRPAAVLVVCLALATVLIGGSRTMLDTSILVAIFSLIGVSLGMLFGQAGIMSLGQASFAALGAYATAIATATYGLPSLLGLALALVVPALVAYPLARALIRLSHLALALATLFIGEIILVLLREGGDLTGGFIGLGGIPPLDFAPTPLAFHLLAWGFVLVAVVLYTNLMASAGGRALNTLRSDPLRAQADGDAAAHRLSALFTFSASLAGAAGWLYAHYMSYLAPESLSVSLSISVLLMVVIGGSRYVLGPVVGALLLTVLNDRLPPEVLGLLYGGTLVLVLLVAPNGVLGIADDLWRSLRARRSHDAQSSGQPEPEPTGAPLTEIGEGR